MTAVEKRPADDEAWFDSHCHLQDEYVTDNDEEGHRSSAELLTAAFQRASDAGVTAMVCVGTGPETSRQALGLARERRTQADTSSALGHGWSSSSRSVEWYRGRGGHCG